MKTDTHPSPTPENTVIIEKRLDSIRAEQANTLAQERSGELEAALDAESTPTLAAHLYALICSPHCANPVFGGNAKRWTNHVARNLQKRGIFNVAAPGCFGWHVVKVSPFRHLMPAIR